MKPADLLRGPALPIAAALALALAPAVLSPYGLDLLVRIMILSVFALSLHLLVGVAGLVSLGHAAFFGIGAYLTVKLSPESAAGSVPLLLTASMAGAAAYALFVGAFSLRTQGVYFIMVTLAFAQMAYFVVHDTPLGGGTDGIYLNLRPVWEAGAFTLDTDIKAHRYALCWVVLAATYGVLAVLQRSRFGHALAGIRVNERRMRAAGFPTFGYKLAAFVIAGALAGAAGFLLAVVDGFVNPELLAWHESGAVLLMVILGGLGSLRGAVVGAAAFVLLKEVYASEALLGPLAGHWPLALGLTIIACVVLLPRGIVGWFAGRLK